jgi:hypothetical protein
MLHERAEGTAAGDRPTGGPPGYSGGFAVSSTMAPFLDKDQPPTAHVPGYLSTSVVTVRLWKTLPAQ